MKKHLIFLVFVLIGFSSIYSQTRGVKIGYIDMEYILQNVPNYIEANSQLEQKAQKWKLEIESKKTEINKLKESLNVEKTLLTRGLIDERESEIKFLEKELLDLQQNRFGPNGNLMNQKSDLVKPIQDQVFSAIQDIAEAKKYDFIFDKTSDLTMLFAANRYDISDQVLRIINRSEKREQLTKKQIKLEEEKQKKEDGVNENPLLAERQKIIDERKVARDKLIEERKVAAEEKKKTAEERRAKLIEDRDAKKTGTTSTAKPAVSELKSNNDVEARKQQQADVRAKTLEDRKQAIEDRKRETEEKRAKALEERKLKINAAKTSVVAPETSKTKTTEVKTNDVEARKQEQADAKAKIIEDRKKAIEDRKIDVQAKKAKALEEIEKKKNGTISANPKTEIDKPTNTKVDTKVEPIKKDATTLKEEQEATRAKIIEDRKKAIDERKKIIEDKRLKAIQVRDSIINARQKK